MAFTTSHNGRDYDWEDGNWFDTERNMVAPQAIRGELNAAFLRSIEDPKFMTAVTERGARQVLFDFLRERMGVSVEKLSSIGFFKEAMEACPEVALGNLYPSSSTAPSGRSFVNCTRLRDRFFSTHDAAVVDLPVKLLGSGPFEQDELKAFLTRCNVPIWKRKTSVHVLVLGREAWAKDEVNEVVEAAEGSVLRVYSQEMLISVLAGFPDPFRTFPLTERLWDLFAFRHGHPGLEYVSNGWAGWVKGFGSSAPIAWAEGSSDLNQVEQSPLSVMGYRVGVNGVEENSRKEILRSAFQGPLPFVESSGYMESWGKPATAGRLKRIAQHLANLIEAHRNRANHGVAVSDWKSDLGWLKDTFYQGAYTFSWPQL